MSEPGDIDGELRARLLGALDRSGFPFQLRVADEIRAGMPGRASDWEVLEEHGWQFKPRTEPDFLAGYADLALRHPALPDVHVVVECKRQEPGSLWVFLRRQPWDHTKALTVTRRLHANANRIAWVEFSAADKLAAGAAFYCAIRRPDGSKGELLEDLAATVLKACEAMAMAEPLEPGRDSKWFITVIVTNARLFLASGLEPHRIDLGTGEVPRDTKFEDVPVVALTKNLWSSASFGAHPMDELNRRRNRTVFVVNATSVYSSFLNSLERLRSRPEAAG